jgi:hypothetical protein
LVGSVVVDGGVIERVVGARDEEELACGPLVAGAHPNRVMIAARGAR